MMDIQSLKSKIKILECELGKSPLILNHRSLLLYICLIHLLYYFLFYNSGLIMHCYGVEMDEWI